MTTSYNNLEAEPAFLANKRAKTGRRGDQAAQTTSQTQFKPTSSLQKSLADCCYSSSNLIIILACVIGLFFAIKFVNDEPLYEYGEHLLSLRFYRQIIYIIVIFPLILLVPIFNAASVCCLSGAAASSSSTFKQAGHTKQLGRSSLITKLAYQILVALLAFVGLIFVAPSIRYSGLVKQIDWEFKRHMELRYDKDFSFDFVERIQTVFECCDELWYRSRYNDKLPISCFAPLPIPYSSIYQQTCPEAIGSLVSTRCIIIAACLVAILIGLAILVALDVLELISPRRTYDVRAREQPVAGPSGGSSAAAARSSSPLVVGPSGAIGGPDASISQQYEEHSSDDDDDDDDDGGFIRRRMMASVAEQAAAAAASNQQQQQQHQPNRLGPSERRRERPLLSDERNNTNTNNNNCSTLKGSDSRDDLYRSGPAADSAQLPAILTKASYFSQAHARPKSPVLVRADSPATGGAAAAASSSGHSRGAAERTSPPRGVLKKTSSLARSIDRESLFDRDEQTTTTIERETNLHHEQQTYHHHQPQPTLQGQQRSPFSVRFADS